MKINYYPIGMSGAPRDSIVQQDALFSFRTVINAIEYNKKHPILMKSQNKVYYNHMK
ncbi:hypothetical protein QA612_12125 [Evansella sp. AB-P1]|uniref:hypothetical protein n=1 Tax=Evansella sp. AB-P1 TaxID=3037653 RepID=UPI00241F85C7|nr:hypothetical protein [Evansella sp. AB-P1]MDG5788237.1 hypothetical protein [Evansella sp. AB-P1]